MDANELIYRLVFLYLGYKLITDMSLVKDINELPLTVKAVIVSICGFMPFWFLILYYFFPDIMGLGWYEKAALVFIPSFVWFLLEIATMYLCIECLSLLYGIKIRIGSDFWVVSFLDGLFYFGLISIIAYYGNFQFEKYIWTIFLFRVTFVALFFAMSIYLNKNKNPS